MIYSDSHGCECRHIRISPLFTKIFFYEYTYMCAQKSDTKCSNRRWCLFQLNFVTKIVFVGFVKTCYSNFDRKAPHKWACAMSTRDLKKLKQNSFTLIEKIILVKCYYYRPKPTVYMNHYYVPTDRSKD